jgi:hypothetical protein
MNCSTSAPPNADTNLRTCMHARQSGVFLVHMCYVLSSCAVFPAYLLPKTDHFCACVCPHLHTGGQPTCATSCFTHHMHAKHPLPW